MPIIGITASSISRNVLPVSGASLWLDADDASTFSFGSGTRVSEWRDKSGNGYHFTQATSTVQPDRNATVNGKTAVIFRQADGSGPYWMENSSWNWASSAFTMLCVIRANTGAFSAYLGQDVAGRLQLGQDNNNPAALGMSRIGQATTISSLALARDTVGQITYKSAGVSSGNITVQVYKSKVAATSTITLGSLTTASRSVIGGSVTSNSPNISDPFQAGATTSGVICELILYPSQLSDSNRELVETYLMNKWGI